MTFTATKKVTSVSSLLEDVICNLNDHEEALMGPVNEPVSEMNVTINFKTQEGIKGTILAGYGEGGLDVYERYGSVERYDALCGAFQTELDHFRSTTTVVEINE